MLIPNQAELGVGGLTIFSNASDTIDATGWHLKETAEEAAKSALGSRYTIDASDWRPAKVPDHLSDAAKLESEMASHSADIGGADIVLAIWPTEENQSVYTGTVINGFKGFGVSQHDLPLVHRPPLVHTYGAAALYDGKTYKLIGARPMQLSPEEADKLGFAQDSQAVTELISIGYDGLSPLAPVSWFELPDHWSDVPTDRKDEVRQKLTALLSASVRYTVSHMFFTDEATTATK